MFPQSTSLSKNEGGSEDQPMSLDEIMKQQEKEKNNKEIKEISLVHEQSSKPMKIISVL